MTGLNGRLAHLERLHPILDIDWCRCPFDYAAAVAELVERVRRPCRRCGKWPETTLGVDGEAVEDGRIDAWEEGG